MADSEPHAVNEFLLAMREHTEEQICKLEHGISYTLEQICAKEVWDQLETTDRQTAGRFVSVLVKEGLLNLFLVGKTGANANLYQRKLSTSCLR